MTLNCQPRANNPQNTSRVGIDNARANTEVSETAGDCLDDSFKESGKPAPAPWPFLKRFQVTTARAGGESKVKRRCTQCLARRAERRQ